MKAMKFLIPNPSFPAYENCVKLAEGIPSFYRLPADKDFAFDIEEFKSKVTTKTKVAVVIFAVESDGQDFHAGRFAGNCRSV